MRCVSSCLLLISAPFLFSAGSFDAMAAGAAFRGRAGHHPGAFHAPRSPAVGRFVHRPAFYGRFAHRPYADRHGFRPYRNGFASSVIGGWPAVVDPAGDTTIINQIEASPPSADHGGIPTAVGVRSPPVAAPVIYVIETRRPARRSIRIDRGVPGLSADASDRILPRIVHLVPSR